jgi:hypothetical protein
MNILTPQECLFGIGTEVNDGVLRVQLVIFPKDKDHPDVDCLDNDQLTLPPYLQNLSMDAENVWDWDGNCFKTVEELTADMLALGYTQDNELSYI